MKCERPAKDIDLEPEERDKIRKHIREMLSRIEV